MPRAALGLAVLVIFGVTAPVFAQTMPPTNVVGQPVLSTSFPPEPSASKSPPPEQLLGSTPVTNLPPVLGAPVSAYDSNPSTPGSIRPVAGQSDSQPAPGTYTPVTPDPTNNSTTKKTRGAVLSVQTNEGVYVSPTAVDSVSVQPPEPDPNDFLRNRAEQRDEGKKNIRSNERALRG